MNIMNDKKKNEGPKWSKKVVALICVAAIIFVGFCSSLGYYMAHSFPESWSLARGIILPIFIVALLTTSVLNIRKYKIRGE